ncbi:tetratricopeptide repeat protein [Sphingobium sp. MK2]|uniref:tetratricopeptide repeat protein n=1 Tax=Sphingobium sp. MK2 TaxID=3116540 RepID=UPI0032E3614A
MASQSERSEYPPYYPVEGNYGDLLRWHMDYWGTRPTGSTSVNGVPWKGDEFRREAFGNKWEEPTFITGLRNWRGAGSAPNENNVKSIEEALFGANAIFNVWRKHFKKAWEQSRGKNKNKSTIVIPPPSPPGSLIWIDSTNHAQSAWHLQMIKNEALALEKLGNITKDLNKRYGHYKKAISLFEAADDNHGKLRCLALLGDVKYGALELDAAQSFYEEAISLSSSDNLNFPVTTAKCILAQVGQRWRNAQ